MNIKTRAKMDLFRSSLPMDGPKDVNCNSFTSPKRSRKALTRPGGNPHQAPLAGR